MIKSVLCLFASFILVSKIAAQCDSTFFRYTGTLVTGISLIDTNKIIGVGDNGYIIKSKDGGKSWKNIEVFNRNVLKAVQFATDSVGYTVGTNKTILKTEDEGESWFPLVTAIPKGFSNDYASFNDLYFFNKERGFIVGDNGIIISTTDGGRSWKNVSLNSSDWLSSITFLNDSLGFICGSAGGLYKTENGGRTWQKITLTTGSLLTKIQFINSTTGFIVGFNGICFKTTDTGTTWTQINTPTTGEYYDIYFLNALKGFIVGTYSGGLILQTNDGGTTWETIFNYPVRSASYYCINADPGKQKVVIAGGGQSSEFQGYNGRNILSTTDAGTTYISLSGNGRLKYNDMCFLNDSTGYITGEDGVVLKTSDYGESWKPLQGIPAEFSNNQARKIIFLDSLHGFASSDNIYKTSDGAKTWVKTTIPGPNLQFFPRQMYFFDSLKGLVQNDGIIYKTIDGGSSWTDVATSASFYRDFAVNPAGKAFAVGYGGEAQVSTDEGTTWAPFNLNTTKYLTGIYFYDSNIGFIGTADAAIFKTTNGGATWTEINTGTQGLQIRSFLFVNNAEGYMMCNNNGGISWIYKTKNGGLTWDFLRQESEDLSAIVGFNRPYIVGGNGMILKMDTLHKPGLPGYISGTGKGCVNDKSSFTTGSMTGVSYTWSLASGGVSVANGNMDTILWTTPGLHTLSVSVSNVCGVSPVRQFTTDVILFEPTISVQDSVFTATEGLSYQWYLNGYFIFESSGGKLRSITGRATGNYTVAVTGFYGCTVITPAIYYSFTKTKSLCPDGNTSIFSGQYGNSYQWQRNDGSGFLNISDNNVYTGTNTYLLQLKAIPSSWYGYKFRCVTDFGNSDTNILQFINSWNGSADTAWENPANWSCSNLPDANTDVVINSGTIVIHSDVTIRSLRLNPAANLTVQSGKTLTIMH